MLRFRLTIPFVVLSLVVLTGWIPEFTGQAGRPPAQEVERSLDIERYSNEPLELVTLKIGDLAVKDKVKSKFRGTRGGLDNVKFKDKEGWFKHVKARVRNVSGRPVYGLLASVYLRHPAAEPVLIELPLTFARDLRQEPLRPGDEINLEVSVAQIEPALERLARRGADANVPSAIFSLSSVSFSHDLKWVKGSVLRRDPDNPDKWDAVSPLAPIGSSRPPRTRGPGSFSIRPAAYRAPAPRPAQSVSNCKQSVAGYIASACSGDASACKQITEIANGIGTLSLSQVAGACKDPDGSPVSCSTSTTHQEFLQDPNCPSMTCVDNDNDGDTTCDGDCDDSNPYLNLSDNDFDGYSTCSGDGNDNDGRENPDCGAYFDRDNDGVMCGYDCSDTDPTRPYPASFNCGYAFEWSDEYCDCIYNPTPVVVDVAGNGFNLTNAAGGVDFDLNTDGQRERLSWTAAGSDDAWLVLDRNGNGAVDNGQELFGNFTPQPAPPPGETKNGFRALAEYDKPAGGGNGDGVIDRRDAVFGSLRLWQDVNHNGNSEPSELKTLDGLDVTVLEFNYHESKRTDEHGNRFRYRA